MEYALLIKLGIAINLVVKTGYLVAGGYFARTAVQYVVDYKESISNEGSRD